MGNDFTPSCRAGSTAPDVSFRWVAPARARYVFDTIGSTFDTVLTLRSSCSGPELPGACDDDGAGVGLASRIVRAFGTGQEALIVVDGFGTSMGAYVLNIRQLTASEAGLCTDGVDNDGDGATDCADPDCAADPGCP